MSQLESGSSYPSYSASVVLIAGASVTSNNANLGANSRLIGITRTVVGGTVGTPHCLLFPPLSAGAGGTPIWTYNIYSSSATDTSTYALQWYNETVPTSLLPPGATQFLVC